MFLTLWSCTDIRIPCCLLLSMDLLVEEAVQVMFAIIVKVTDFARISKNFWNSGCAMELESQHRIPQNCTIFGYICEKETDFHWLLLILCHAQAL